MYHTLSEFARFCFFIDIIKIFAINFIFEFSHENVLFFLVKNDFRAKEKECGCIPFMGLDIRFSNVSSFQRFLILPLVFRVFD